MIETVSISLPGEFPDLSSGFVYVRVGFISKYVFFHHPWCCQQQPISILIAFLNTRDCYCFIPKVCVATKLKQWVGCGYKHEGVFSIIIHPPIYTLQRWLCSPCPYTYQFLVEFSDLCQQKDAQFKYVDCSLPNIVTTFTKECYKLHFGFKIKPYFHKI